MYVMCVVVVIVGSEVLDLNALIFNQIMEQSTPHRYADVPHGLILCGFKPFGSHTIFSSIDICVRLHVFTFSKQKYCEYDLSHIPNN